MGQNNACQPCPGCPPGKCGNGQESPGNFTLDRMERLARKVREAVSGNRTRYKAGGFDLDLTFITPRIIAMGLPSEGVSWKYGYDYSKFDYAILEFGWPDHHAPPLDLIPRICGAMEGWLNADPNNVVAVHCKAGKGRTGVVISAYLAWSGECKSAEEAMETFGRMRGQKGVTIPSQRRYIEYLTRTLAIGEEELSRKAKPLVLVKVLVNTIPHVERDGLREKKGCRPYFEVNRGARCLWSSDNGLELHYYKPSDGAIMVRDIGVVLWGDVYIKCYHAASKRKTKDTFVFRFAFNTAFVSSGILSLKRDQLDGPHKNPGDFDDDYDETQTYHNTLSEVQHDDECWKYIDIKEQREEESRQRRATNENRNFERGRAQTAFHHHEIDEEEILETPKIRVDSKVDSDVASSTFDFVDEGLSGITGAHSFRRPSDAEFEYTTTGKVSKIKCLRILE